MKCIFLALAATFCPLLLTAQQWDGPANLTDPLYRFGPVGVGAGVPSEKLEIVGYDKLNFRVGRWTALGIVGHHLATVIGNNVKASAINNNMEVMTTAHQGAKAIKMQYNEGITFHTFHGQVTAGDAFTSYERMRVDNNGRVGIGLTSPVGKLHVAGSAYFGNENANAFYRVAIGSSGSNYGSIGYGYTYTTSSSVHQYAVADYASQLRFDVGEFAFLTAPSGSIGANVNFTPAVVIKQSGAVGIGTDVPDEKLTVKGKIHTSEVRVDLEPEVVPPDYVFEKEYDLMSLSEIEAYVNANKHLPEVPSAKEMKEEGLNLKEMNLLLLKKVEELTLHLIELKKENETQQARIESQEQSIRHLMQKAKTD